MISLPPSYQQQSTMDNFLCEFCAITILVEQFPDNQDTRGEASLPKSFFFFSLPGRDWFSKGDDGYISHKIRPFN